MSAHCDLLHCRVTSTPQLHRVTSEPGPFTSAAVQWKFVFSVLFCLMSFKETAFPTPPLFLCFYIFHSKRQRQQPDIFMSLFPLSITFLSASAGFVAFVLVFFFYLVTLSPFTAPVICLQYFKCHMICWAPFKRRCRGAWNIFAQVAFSCCVWSHGVTAKKRNCLQELLPPELLPAGGRMKANSVGSQRDHVKSALGAVGFV